MKHRIFIISSIVFLLFGFVSCDEPESKKYRIGVSQCSNDAWRTKLNEEMERELLFHPGVELEVRSADADNDRQASDIDYFVSQKVDLLVVSPNQADQLTPAVSRAFDAGIPVIVADRKVSNEKYTAFIGGDNLAVGRQMAQYLMDQLPEGGKVLEVMGLPGSTPTVLRHEGLMEELSGASGNYEFVSCTANWLKDTAEVVVYDVLQEQKDIQIILAQNDQMAIGAYQALIRSNFTHAIPIMGVDGLTGPGNGVEAISQGMINVSASYATGGDLIIQTALKILEGEPFERNTELPTYLINLDDAPLINNLSKEVVHQVETVQMLKERVDYFWEQHNLERALLYTLLTFFAVFILMFGAFLIQYNAKHKANERLARKSHELEEKNEQLTQLTQRLEEATQAKLAFFTNVSHDFRTPLTLISTPLEYLVKEEKEAHRLRLLNIAHKNVQVLLRLINQILDFRKYESGKLELNLQNLNLKEMVEAWYASFEGLAQKKHIHLSLRIEETADEKAYWTQGDSTKLERVFFNLVGNAFKFTPENGTIAICLRRSDNQYILSVEDSGPGIRIENIQQIFEQFYQVDSIHHEGSGLGLALVKSFVELHGGTIQVADRKEGLGTLMTVRLPAREPQPDETMVTNQSLISPQQIETELLTYNEEVTPDAEDPKPVVLVIDDNPDIRQLLIELLGKRYHVLTAANAQEGIAKAMRTVPNVIVCDVMMPGMDGMECCRRLKSEVNTCHIPVLMLTACSLDEQRVQGYQEGADAYLSKPFNEQVLMAQLESLITNHDRVRDFFSDALVNLQPTSKTAGKTHIPTLPAGNVRSMDDSFLQKVRQNIQKHLADADYGIEQMAEEVGMSRAQLYRKIKALTNYSPVELVRNTRLKQAQLILAQGQMTIAEVAYSVGFTAPSYFTKCYKEYFGENPNELIKRKG